MTHRPSRTNQVRIIYRFAEFSSVSHEASRAVLVGEGYFWALEAVPMLIAILAFNIVHPGMVLVGENSHMPGFFTTCVAFVKTKGGQTELVQSSEKKWVVLQETDEDMGYGRKVQS